MPTPPLADVASIAQFGFTAVAAWMLWVFIRDLVPRLLEIIRQNAEALQRMAVLVEETMRSGEKTRTMMGDVSTRLARLEEQHEHLRECPLGDGCPLGFAPKDKDVGR